MAETIRLEKPVRGATTRPEPTRKGDDAASGGGRGEAAEVRPPAGLFAGLRRLAGGRWSSALPWRRRGPQPEPSEEGEAKPPTPWFQRLGGRLSDLRSLVTNLVTLFVIVALVVTVARELPRNAMVIDPIEAPGVLVGEGYKPTVVAQRVMDEMLAIRRAATTRKEGREVSPEWQQIDIDVPGTGLSVRAILRIVRGFLGLPETRIGGEIVRDGEIFRLRLRIAGLGAVAEPEGRPAEALDELLNLGARELMRAVDPYILASYLADIDREAAVATIKHCLVNDRPDDDAWAYNLWGLLLAERGAFEEAIEKYALAIEKAPDLALADNNWGTALHRLKDYEGAIVKYQAALEIDPDFTSAYNNWGTALVALGNFDAAIGVFRRALEIDPDHPAAYVNWAVALATAGDREAALEKFRAAATVDPGYARAYREWGDVLHERGDYAAASAKYATAAELDPDHAPTQVNWGRTLSALGDVEAAGHRYRRAIALEPDNASAYNNLGSVLSKLEDHAAAALAFGRAAALDEGFAAALDNWGIALVKLGRYAEAKEKFEQALQLDPERYAEREGLIAKLEAIVAKAKKVEGEGSGGSGGSD